MVQLIDEVRRSIERHRLLSRGEAVVVGVSGGPDSLCLLHVLCRLVGEYELTLHVAHLNHSLRGEEATADADFVRAVATDWGLPCTVERVQVRVLADQYDLAVEEAARRARYSFLGRVAEVTGASVVAVGHNADDQAETVLMHWLRGSGLAGLRGMLPSIALGDYRLLEGPVSPSRTASLRLVRPLLEIDRESIEAYCEYYGLEPRFDRSNLDTTLFRNWLRHKALPLLSVHNPNVKQVLQRTARVVADDYALLRTLLEESWPDLVLEEGAERIVFDLGRWRALPTSMQRSTIREAVHRLRRSLRDISFLHVENALHVGCEGTTGNRSTLPSGLMLEVGYDHLVVASEGVSEPLPNWPLLPPGAANQSVAVPGFTQLVGSEWELEVRVIGVRELPSSWASNPDPWTQFVDASVTGARIWLRTRVRGDRFRPLGMKGHTVKLADFLTNEKVPHPIRERLPLLVSEDSIVWVCGQRLDERFRVTDATTHILALAFRRADDAPS